MSDSSIKLPHLIGVIRISSRELSRAEDMGIQIPFVGMRPYNMRSIIFSIYDVNKDKANKIIEELKAKGIKHEVEKVGFGWQELPTIPIQGTWQVKPSSSHKRYLLFGGYDYYPSGGWNDYFGDFDSISDAKDELVKRSGKGYPFAYDWWHIVDSDKREIVLDQSRKVKVPK